MVVRKEDCKAAGAMVQKQLDEASAQIDAFLSHTFIPGRKVTIPPDSYSRLDYIVRQQLFELYRGAGWTVEYHDDQREGEWVNFS
jgi:hypothetical protein